MYNALQQCRKVIVISGQKDILFHNENNQFTLRWNPHKAQKVSYSNLFWACTNVCCSLFHPTVGQPSPSLAACLPGQPRVWSMTRPEHSTAATKADSEQHNSAPRKQCRVQVWVSMCARSCVLVCVNFQRHSQSPGERHFTYWRMLPFITNSQNTGIRWMH